MSRFDEDIFKPIFHEINLVKSWLDLGESCFSLVRTNQKYTKIKSAGTSVLVYFNFSKNYLRINQECKF